jgi:hypothetical protein
MGKYIFILLYTVSQRTSKLEILIGRIRPIIGRRASALCRGRVSHSIGMRAGDDSSTSRKGQIDLFATSPALPISLPHKKTAPKMERFIIKIVFDLI